MAISFTIFTEMGQLVKGIFYAIFFLTKKSRRVHLNKMLHREIKYRIAEVSMASFSELKKRNFIYSLEKGLSVLSLFSQLGPQLTLTQLAKGANMRLGTATRYIQTLTELGYLTRDPSSKKYRLAPKILTLGFSLLKDMDLRARLTPHLSEINRELGVGAQCAILDETEIVYVERFRSRSLVSLDLTVGSRLPAYCSALGRAILAFMGSKSVNHIVAKMDMAPLTPFTITNKGDFFRELELTYKRGYAINMQEIIIGYSGLAAPIFNDGFVEGSFGFSFPHSLIENKKSKSALIERLMRIAQDVTILQLNENAKNFERKQLKVGFNVLRRR